MSTKKEKISIDITTELKEKVLDLAYKNKIYKFGPCVNFIISEYFRLKEEGLI